MNAKPDDIWLADLGLAVKTSCISPLTVSRFPRLNSDPLKVGEVVRDDCELRVKRCRGNEQISIWEQCAPPIEFCVQCGRTVNNAVCQRENDTALTKGLKGGLLRSGLFSLEASQDFVAGDDRERDSTVFDQIERCSVCDLWMLLE
jgi:hypothetical protein